MRPGRALLAVGGVLNLGVAALHVAMVIAGPAAYRYFGAGRLASLAADGSPLPALITLPMAVVFAGCGLYALSGAGLAPRLPLLRTGLVTIGAVFTLRGLFLPLELHALARAPQALPPRQLVFSVVSLVIGLLYLAGTVATWRGLDPAALAHRDLERVIQLVGGGD
jgi:hypothetical protein